MANPILTSAFSDNPLTADIIERYMHERVLSIAMKETVFWGLGRMVKIPPGESKTITFQRYERMVPQRRPLVEGVAPLGRKIVVNKVPAIAEQWGNLCTLTDVAMLVVRSEPFQKALELIGLDAAMTVDREVQRVLIAGTNVFFPNDRADRTFLLTTDFPNTPLMRKILAKLKNNGAPAYEGRRYVGVCDPFNSGDVQADPTFVAAAQYSNLTALQEAEIGVWMKVRWQESNNMPTLASDAAVLATSTSPVADGGETALAADSYNTVLVGLDVNGFEVLWGGVDTEVVAGTDVLVLTTPALPAGIEAFNVYVSKGAGSIDYRLQGQDILGSTVVTVNGGGTHTSDSSTESFTFSAASLAMGLTPPAGVDVHQMYVFGNEYYACTELEGIQIFKSGAGPVKVVDPLDQLKQVGWKAFFKAVITNEQFGCRIECSSAFGS